jgi:hypothetical protein
MDSLPHAGHSLMMSAAEAPRPPVPVMTLLSFLARGVTTLIVRAGNSAR